MGVKFLRQKLEMQFHSLYIEVIACVHLAINYVNNYHPNGLPSSGWQVKLVQRFTKVEFLYKQFEVWNLKIADRELQIISQ